MKHLSILVLCFATLQTTFAQNAPNCPDINNKIVVNGSEIFFVQKCVLHPIANTQLYNLIIAMTNMEPIEISDEKYATLIIGNRYSEADFTSNFESLSASYFANLCQIYEQQIVSSDNTSFYYIEHCLKRKFLNSNDVETFKNTSSAGAIRSIDKFALTKIKNGTNMYVYKTLTSKKTDLEIAKTLPSSAHVCAQVKDKAKTPFVTYYESIFYFKNCTLHRMKDLTLEMMQEADAAGGIYELSTQEVLALPEGKPWNNQN